MAIASLGDALLVTPPCAESGMLARAREVLELAPRLAIALPAADVVPGGTTLLVAGATADELEGALASLPAARSLPPPTLHRIEVAYDGPDLADVARATGQSIADVIARHAEPTYVALVAGFLPGFAYLGELDERLERPRLASPRSTVPAGSVGIAGRMTGVYPFASPGGWNLLGRALAPALFDPAREPPRRIAPLDQVRFVPVEPREAPTEVRTATRSAVAAPRVALRVEACVPLCTLQDLGRAGRRAQGLPSSGALDVEALLRANRAVGNPDTAAAIEVPLGPLTVRATGRVVLSVDGEPARALGDGESRTVVPEPGRAVRYLAVRGGLDVPLVLGSRSTLLVAALGGFEGRRLRRGDCLPVGPDPGTPLPMPAPGVPPAADEVTWLDVRPAAPDARLGPEALDALLAGRFAVGASSDRVGTRLEGDRLPRAGDDRALPEPVLPGCVQLTTSGQPVVLGPDAAITGGYPVVATLDRASRDRLARLAPGRGVRFRLAR